MGSLLLNIFQGCLEVVRNNISHNFNDLCYYKQLNLLELDYQQWD